MVGALIYFGTQTGFVAWVFAIPFAAVGLLLYIFGRWSERVASTPRIPLATAAPATTASPALPARAEAAADTTPATVVKIDVTRPAKAADMTDATPDNAAAKP